MMGLSPLASSHDGRYDKQQRKEDRLKGRKEQEMVLDPRTEKELRAYIEEKYQVSELDHTDERYRRAYMGVKSHLVFRDAPEILKTPEMPLPDHPPVSEKDPDYLAFRANQDERFKEAVMLPSSEFSVHLHVYSIPVKVNSILAAWLEVYIESVHHYLAFSTVALEFEEHYSIDKIRNDIIRAYGATEEDREKDSERYRQLVSIL